MATIATVDLCTVNAWTLGTAARQLEFAEALKKIRWSVVGVTKARIKGSGALSLPPDVTLFHSGGGVARAGVAFVIESSLVQQAQFNPISDRVATLTLQTLRLHLVLVYASVNSGLGVYMRLYPGVVDMHLWIMGGVYRGLGAIYRGLGSAS